MAGQGERHRPAHPGVRQVQPNRRHVLPRRLRLRSPNATVTPAPRAKSWSNSDAHTPFPKRRHGRGDKALSRQQIGLRRLQLQAQCCPEHSTRKVPRDLHEDARDVAREHAATPEYVAACRRRKKVEMLFAHLKRILAPHALAAKGSERSQRRISPRGYRPESETTRPLKTDQ